MNSATSGDGRWGTPRTRLCATSSRWNRSICSRFSMPCPTSLTRSGLQILLALAHAREMQDEALNVCASGSERSPIDTAHRYICWREGSGVSPLILGWCESPEPRVGSDRVCLREGRLQVAELVAIKEQCDFHGASDSLLSLSRLCDDPGRLCLRFSISLRQMLLTWILSNCRRSWNRGLVCPGSKSDDRRQLEYARPAMNRKDGACRQQRRAF